MKTREQILAENPLDRVMRDYGITVPATKQAMVKCCFHEDGKASLSVNTETGLFHCHGCKVGGSVIDFVSLKDGISAVEAIKRLSNEPEPYKNVATVKPQGKARVLQSYSYRDELGLELYQVVRMEPKDFRQRHAVDGQWVWNMQGVRRVLYNLPKILKSKVSHIWIVEGEKDADNLSKCGYVATCNVGGAGKWMEGYTESLAGKEIILCGDNDKPGREHMEKVLESLAKPAKTIRQIAVPSPHKDVSDFIESFKGDFEVAAKALFDLVENAAVLTGGVVVPVQTMGELEREYQEHVRDAETCTLNLGKWLPSLGRNVRGLVPGELVILLADTGVGKTACLQNLAIAAAPVSTLLFELELPGTLTFERFAAMASGIHSSTVYNHYRSNETVAWKETGKLDHIVVCSKSRLTPMDIERIIIQTELKTGNRPRIVLLDYIGLVRGEGKSKYEKISSVAEDMKVVAKVTKTIIVISSQVARKERDTPEITLHDGKDSGSIENSAGLVLGLWRNANDAKLLHARVLKNTKGQSGFTIDCNFNGQTMQITERTIEPSEIPEGYHVNHNDNPHNQPHND